MLTFHKLFSSSTARCSLRRRVWLVVSKCTSGLEDDDVDAYEMHDSLPIDAAMLTDDPERDEIGDDAAMKKK